jgi:type I restriction-modification system DNA methylase subunit
MSLFNKKTIARAIAFVDAPDASKQALLSQWAATIKSGEIETQKETALHGNFKSKIIVEVLGYRDFNDSGAWTVDVEAQIGAGSVDLAFGHFTADTRNIIAPFELKGAKTKNLDAIMPGRAKSPVDQAWEYATNNVGTKWVLVSNYLEIRLYSYGEGRQAYETFDLRRLAEPEEYARAQLLLSAENLLGGRTAELLEESRRENKDITNRLYGDYKTLRSDLIGEVRRERPEMDPLAAIRTGQTILDRILFIAFAEDTSLLPPKSIEKAYEHADPYHPRPVWETFQSLFNAIDTGLPKALNIPRYNGGLFAPDETINALAIPDHICEGFKRLSEYDFASEISVTVLGHIFEQSIADVEQLQAEARGDAPPEKKTSGTSGRRKRDGVVYTPDYIARFIVEQTLGTHAREIFTRLLTEHASKGASADDDPIKWKSTAAERTAWAAYRDALAKLRIVDPACGSGVFLVMAFDWLKAELARVNEKLVELTGVGALLDPDSEILTHNLFGVDVNEESVEIAKLSLWIKTARHGKVLDSLDNNFRVGDSLIEDSSFAYRSHGFVWKEAFKDIFAEGGFDIVLGNPPYVKGGLFSRLKPYLKTRFEVYQGSADLFAYFFERGLRLLKVGGRLGYISSSTFFKTSSGEPLRDFLRLKATLETVVDFGDNQIFEGVTTYPAILTMVNLPPHQNGTFNFWKYDATIEENFEKAFDDGCELSPQNALTNDSWALEGKLLRALRTKIVDAGIPLKKVYGSPFRGVLTGRNDVFVIDENTKNDLLAKNSNSADLLKPWLDGGAIQKWHIQPNQKWLIFTRRGTDLDAYPAIKAYLEQKRAILEPKPTGWVPANPKDEWGGRKEGSYLWFEMQDVIGYHGEFAKPKILFRDISASPTFLMERAGLFNDTTSYFIPTSDVFLLSILNSNAFWFWIKGKTPMARGGFYRFKAQYIERTPIPPATDDQKAALASLAESAQAAAEKRYCLQLEIARRIPDLAPSGNPPKMTDRLKSWWDLPDFAAFQAEVKKAFKADIPLKERNDWESWISETRQQIHALTAKITALEADINTRVYALFGLTPDEITLLESSL